MEATIADRFVGMWVNEMTLDCGERGRQSVQLLLDRGHDAGVIPRRVIAEFVEA
jgi:1,4-dihydroxy-6-naphthoate synthase